MCFPISFLYYYFCTIISVWNRTIKKLAYMVDGRFFSIEFQFWVFIWKLSTEHKIRLFANYTDSIWKWSNVDIVAVFVVLLQIFLLFSVSQIVDNVVFIYSPFRLLRLYDGSCFFDRRWIPFALPNLWNHHCAFFSASSRPTKLTVIFNSVYLC